jgi:hypothetical protein
LPLFLIIGVRSYYAHKRGASTDSCPVFTEPILSAWKLPYVLLDDRHSGADLGEAYRQAQERDHAFAVLLAE